MEIKNQHQLQLQIAEHYKKGEQTDVIYKTSIACEMLLNIGMASATITLRMIDLGVKKEDIGMAMALAMKKTDDKYLSPLDVIIKKIVLQNHSKMIEELEAFL